MKTRNLLCEKCKAKIRTAEAIYQRERRKQLKVAKQTNKNKKHATRTKN